MLAVVPCKQTNPTDCRACLMLDPVVQRRWSGLGGGSPSLSAAACLCSDGRYRTRPASAWSAAEGGRPDPPARFLTDRRPSDPRPATGADSGSPPGAVAAVHSGRKTSWNVREPACCSSWIPPHHLRADPELHRTETQ